MDAQRHRSTTTRRWPAAGSTSTRPCPTAARASSSSFAAGPRPARLHAMGRQPRLASAGDRSSRASRQEPRQQEVHRRRATISCARTRTPANFILNAAGNPIPTLGKTGVLTAFYGNPRQVFAVGGRQLLSFHSLSEDGALPLWRRPVFSCAQPLCAGVPADYMGHDPTNRRLRRTALVRPGLFPSSPGQGPNGARTARMERDSGIALHIRPG